MPLDLRAHLCPEVPLVVRIRLYNRGLCRGDCDAELRELPNLRQQKNASINARAKEFADEGIKQSAALRRG